jgi:hypothetical protein
MAQGIKIGLYADGDYMCKCTNCGKEFQGDKRAIYCFHCAAPIHIHHHTGDEMILSRRKFIALVGSAAAVAALPKLSLERKGAIDDMGLYVREWSGGRVRFELSKNYQRTVMPSFHPKDLKELMALAHQVADYGYLVLAMDEGHADRESCCLIVPSRAFRIGAGINFTDPSWRA